MSFAGTDESLDRSAIEKSINKALPSTRVSSVTHSQIPGLVEIVAGNNVLYGDPGGRYLMVGSLYDMQTATDLTAQRKRELASSAKLQWQDLPLDTAVKYGGQGPTKLAVFFDPDCPWCKRLHQVLAALDDVEVFAILYPVESLHPDAKDKAASILCHDDPLQALDTVMSGGDFSAAADPDCLLRSRDSIDRVIAFAQANGIRGTPTLVATDGRIRPGFMTREQLLEWLDASGS